MQGKKNKVTALQVETSPGAKYNNGMVYILSHEFTETNFIAICDQLAGKMDLMDKLNLIFNHTRFTGICEPYKVAVKGTEYLYGIHDKYFDTLEIGTFIYKKWKDIRQPQIRNDFFYRLSECDEPFEKIDIIKAEIEKINEHEMQCKGEVKKEKEVLINPFKSDSDKMNDLLDRYPNPHDLSWLKGFNAEKRRVIPIEGMERENLEGNMRTAVAGASYYALKRELQGILDNGLDTAPVILLDRIEWNGSQKQLGELFVVLLKKGYISKIKPKTIQACFTDSNTIAQVVKTTQGKGYESTYDGIYSSKYEECFYGIKEMPKSKANKPK